MNIQFKKGVLELCVLSLLDRRDFYGYELVEHISQYINISEGTIYPLLRKFRAEGYVTTYLEESQEGPPRKYYKLTARGEEVYEDLEIEWQSFIDGVNNILRGELS
ncbi:PadR family transcriptional regulator [Tissierella praeacuta]|uniref:Transcriptional regulator, PadR family n=1 Tax=Tissierella praeacuta DSM 18095 TaxID=1123404 RepID=A0A1M4W131_9FIRM|nr:PadR family transcriptional regulator [Tissierella praeacuta]HAE91595.1 PadR family transcriptional regulator [Tissierella sp.]MBU5256691.1 PadR family transcriptional regulator [Tissierella praeacuta]TCU75693.1 PadR family transcriptional regulator [Tissierella praeacuta]SHE74662.1 transcriptional regulator, PadR family [Tissierella praeacuta DSM 18095]SUP00237.1 transcriptional regulator, Acidobacterial, PadR-family [Tissierella praeacuta]